MAKNKAKAQVEEQVSGGAEVVYEEVKAGDGGSAAPTSFFQKYRNLIVVGGIGAVVVGVFLVLRMSGNKEANKEGQSAMVNAVLEFERDSFAIAVAGSPRGIGFDAMVEQYGNTDAGQLSRFYAGVSQLQTGATDQGIEQLEGYSKGSTMVGAAAYAAIGYAHEQKGEFAEAADAYANAARTPKENAFSTPFYLMHAARNHESAGANDEALEMYRNIRDKYPLSQEATTVDKYIARLSAEDE